MSNISELASAGGAIVEQMEGPLFDIQEASIAHFIDSDPPVRQYILDGCLPLGISSCIAGAGGSSKSQLVLQIAIGVATGQPICGDTWHPAEERGVLCLFAEEDKDEIHRRVHSLLKSSKKLIQKKAVKNLYIKSVVGQNNQLTVRNGNAGDVDTTMYLKRLKETVKQVNNLGLIIIDPASRFRGGVENDSTDSTRFVEACEELAQETGATVLILHHVNKESSGSGISQNNARGSSAFVDALRWVMNMRTMTDKEADIFGIDRSNRYSYVQVVVTKNNYAAPQAGSVWLERTDNGVLMKAELVSRRHQEKIEHELVIYNRVASESNNGNIYSKTGFIKKFSGKDGELKIGRDKLKSLIEEMIRSGRLDTRQPTDEEKKANKNIREVLKCGKL